ncbi:MAG TPA: rhodanese-like domain-containing protein [Saprospiraceae bacterium]|nr:rhodanese-like domain-containing protein [Saprospiraceae bacterium]HMQ85301.1 rhodanese-like domain-containing protein [Saprospiraceae bacterium]
MLRKIFLSMWVLILGIYVPACAQTIPEKRPEINNPAFDKKISQLIRFSVPTIGVEELKNIQREVLIFDARNKEEFDVSHLPGAVFLGYNQPNWSVLDSVPKDTPIVLYCSIGYRSEKVGEQLLKKGFTQVFNLYGSIFEWVNQGNPVVDASGQAVNQVHTYNADWGKWMENAVMKKVW